MYDLREVGSQVKRAREAQGMSQRELATRIGTSQPALARLERGLSNPSLRTLTRCAEALGLVLRVELTEAPARDPVVERYKQDVDRTLLRENLRRGVDERLRSLGEWQRAGDELRQATKNARRSLRDRR